MGFVNLSSIFL